MTEAEKEAERKRAIIHKRKKVQATKARQDGHETGVVMRTQARAEDSSGSGTGSDKKEGVVLGVVGEGEAVVSRMMFYALRCDVQKFQRESCGQEDGSTPVVVPVVLPGPTEEGEPPPAEAEGEVPLPLSRTLSAQVRDTLRAVRARHFHSIIPPLANDLSQKASRPQCSGDGPER